MTEPPPSEPAPRPAPPPVRSPVGRRRPPVERLIALAGVAVLLAGGALGLARVLDRPVDSGARDASQPIVVGDVFRPGTGVPGRDGGVVPDTGALPPLALVLDRPLPAGLERLPPLAQVARLRGLAADSGSARRLVELGSVYQTLGETSQAEAAYRRALRAGPDDGAAAAGLAMVEGGRGGDAGLGRAARRLGALSRRRPDDQIVAFNVGWLAVYRSDGETAARSWRRVAALGPRTRLGAFATRLLDALARQGDRATP